MQVLEGTHAAKRRPLAPVPPDAHQFAVAMRDGTRLATDVYLPSGPGPFPTLLARMPYDKAGDECFMPAVARWFTRRGYAVVVQDVRGKCRSDGDLAPFRFEVADGSDTLDWVVRQSWCDGAVGMIGDSYYGYTQWAAAASGHPALKAITPRVTGPDIGVFERQGVFPLEVVACWALETWVDNHLYEYDGQIDWSTRPLSEILPAMLDGRRPVGLDQWALTGRDATPAPIVNGRVPALHLAGFFDFFHRQQLAAWRTACAAAQAPQYLILDCTDHASMPLRDVGSPVEDPWGDARSLPRFLDGYLGPLLPFLDYYVRGVGEYDAPPVRWRLGHGEWHATTEWPPPCSEVREWLAEGGSGALVNKTSAETTLTWTHDPTDPVPSLAHPYYPLMQPVDQRSLTERPDVLFFATAPLQEPLDLAGPVTVGLTLRAGGGSTHTMAQLVDVHPDGSHQQVLEGAARIDGPWPAAAEVDLGHVGYRFRAGHRLGLRLAASSYPRYVVHPGTDEHPWTARHSRPQTQTVVLGGDQGLRIRCRVLGKGAS